MHILTDWGGREPEIEALFAAVFTASEGEAEGALIGALVRRMLTGTPPQDLRLFAAEEDRRIVAAAVFSRLCFASDPRRVMILSPLAVATDRQGAGLGQALVRHALGTLRGEGVDIAMTYGDPAFYGRIGFRPVDPATVPPPQPLCQPHGWIGLSLTDAPLSPLPGPCTCVPALDDPALW